MSRASEIYYKASQASQEEHKRLVRQFIAGKIEICPCGMDMERAAIIAAFDEALALPRADRGGE